MQDTLHSMTGFGHSSNDADWGRWSVEAKSVNGRGLDVRTTLPSGFDGLERFAKAEAGQRFHRGHIQIAIRLEANTQMTGGASVNQTLLDSLIASVSDRLPAGTTLSSDAIATLHTVKGVVEIQSVDSRTLAQDETVLGQLRDGVVSALDNLAADRAREGQSLAALFQTISQGFRDTLADAVEAAATQPETLRARLTAQLADIGADGVVDADRLAAEIALSVAKADVREELDRLAAHLDALDGLVATGRPIGRKLDFLSQEIGREANTLCSKASAMTLTEAGLALKALNDQFKEQAANAE